MRGLFLLAGLLLASPLLADPELPVNLVNEDAGVSRIPADPVAAPATPAVREIPKASSEAVPEPEKETGTIGRESGRSLLSGPTGSGEPTRGWQGAGACLLVGLLLGLGVWMLKRAFPSRLPAGSGTLMEVLARTPVGPKQSVVLLRVAGRVLVVGVGPENLSTLSEIADAGEVEKLLLQSPKPPAGDFRSRLLTGVLSPFASGTTPMGAFGEAGGAGTSEKDELAGEIRALGRKVAGWRLEDGARE